MLSQAKMNKKGGRRGYIYTYAYVPASFGMILLDLKRLLTPFIQAGRTAIGLDSTLGGGLANTGSGGLRGRGGFRVVTVELFDGFDHYRGNSVSTTIASL